MPMMVRPNPRLQGFGTMNVPSMIGGSGVVVDAQRGLILTTRSAMAGLPQFAIVLADGRELPCQRVVEDGATDLAVLSVDPKGVPLTDVEWGDSDSLKLGDWVLAVGRPTGTTQAISAGIVSGRDAAAFGSPASELELIRSDVRLAATGSGGPLVNLAGQVVGINLRTPIPGLLPDGFGVSVPAALARRVASDLAEHGRVRRGYLGLTLGPGGVTSPDLPAGLVITSVTPSSPAAEAGFQVGDRIVALDGRPTVELESLARAVEAAPIGQEFRITVERGGKRLDLTVKSRPRPETSGRVSRGALPPVARSPDRRLRPRPRTQEPAAAAKPSRPRRDRDAPLQSEGPDDSPALPPTLRPDEPTAPRPPGSQR
jgi:serine protease Do